MIQSKNYYTFHGDTDIAVETENSNCLNDTSSSSFQATKGFSRSNFYVSVP